MQIDGGCHCGRITYRAEIDPARISICHCTDCQTLTGSPFRVTVLCGRDAIHVAGDAPTIYEKSGDSGRKRWMHFCGSCGTQLFASGANGESGWGVRWGSITQRAVLSPQRQIWCRSAVSWLGEIAGLPKRVTD